MAIFLTVIGKTSTGYCAHCPDVLGCAAVGKSVEKVIANMKEALQFHFEGMVEDGERIPKPGGVNSYRRAIKDFDIDKDFLARIHIDTNQYFAAPSVR